MAVVHSIVLLARLVNCTEGQYIVKSLGTHLPRLLTMPAGRDDSFYSGIVLQKGDYQSP